MFYLNLIIKFFYLEIFFLLVVIMILIFEVFEGESENGSLIEMFQYYNLINLYYFDFELLENLILFHF